jgi:hypothetical protein
MMKDKAFQFILAILLLSLHGFNTSIPIESGVGGTLDATDFVSQNLLDSAYLEMVALRFEGVGRIIEAERAMMAAKRLKSSPSISRHTERIKSMQCWNSTSSDFHQVSVSSGQCV